MYLQYFCTDTCPAENAFKGVGNCSFEIKINNCDAVTVTTIMTNVYKKCLTYRKSTVTNFSFKADFVQLITHKLETLFAITPTYARDTQKVDLTSLCQTIMHVKDIVWIVVEDSENKTALVSNLLKRCQVPSVHLNILTTKGEESRGVAQRNAGLKWIRDFCSGTNCNGSVYFMDDDNKYDLRLFDEVSFANPVYTLILIPYLVFELQSMCIQQV